MPGRYLLPNQRIILANQKIMQGHQWIIKQNQESLPPILKNQAKILALLRK